MNEDGNDDAIMKACAITKDLKKTQQNPQQNREKHHHHHQQQQQQQQQHREKYYEASKHEQKPIKKSSTSLLCELTRLKTQQKYLECNQVKLNPNNFLDIKENGNFDYNTNNDNDDGGDNVNDDNDDADKEPFSSDTKKLKKFKKKKNTQSSVVNLINEIEYLKSSLNENFEQYRNEKRADIQDMWHCLRTIKSDVFRPERLSRFSMQQLRERIIGINKHLDRLATKNTNELLQLKDDYDKIDSDVTILLKDKLLFK